VAALATWTSRSLQRQVRVFRRDRLGLVGLIGLVCYALVAILSPYITAYGPDEITRDSDGSVSVTQPPSSRHPFGTTNMGRDVWSGVVYGTRTAFIVGAVTALAITALGTAIGIISAFFGRWVDELCMRVVDICYSLPLEPFVIIIVSFTGPSIWTISFGTTLLMWRSSARVIRAETLSIAKEPFVEAARAIGASNSRILWAHILPNVMPISTIYIAIGAGWAVLVEANVSFLGYGDPHAISWGRLLNQVFVTGMMRHAWWWVLFPGLALMLFVTCIFFVSRAYERELNPQLKEL